jgi:aminoglycoside phosphotransferase (APT) family kinase protein
LPLPNPELEWMRAPTQLVSRDEVERRIGPTGDALQLLGGGMSNVNIRVGRARVLRIYRGLDESSLDRDPSIVGKEAALASRDWRAFRTPRVLARGPDFLVFEYLEHSPLSEPHGSAVGRALAEIHAVTYPAIGFLGENLTVTRPLGDGDFTPRMYGHSQLADAGPLIETALAARIARFLDTEPLAARDAVDVPVLTHSDFKTSNVHWGVDGRPVILDWEFAWSGSRYVDLGQLLRWQPSEPFVRDFEAAYIAGGCLLFADWRRFAELVDLGSLLGLYRNPAARTTDHVVRRIVETIER